MWTFDAMCCVSPPLRALLLSVPAPPTLPTPSPAPYAPPWPLCCGEPARPFFFPPRPLPARVASSQTCQYHSREWITNLNARPDCRVVPLDDLHWLMSGPVAAEYEAAVLDWLATTSRSPGAAAVAAKPAAAPPVPVAPVVAASVPGGERKKEL